MAWLGGVQELPHLGVGGKEALLCLRGAQQRHLGSELHCAPMDATRADKGAAVPDDQVEVILITNTQSVQADIKFASKLAP